MSFSRLYVYSMRKKPYRYLYFPRKRVSSGKWDSADQNTAEILKKIDHATKLDESLSRTKRIVRDKLFCNYFDYFCTFTFNQNKVDRFNYSQCQKKITEVFKNYKNRYSPSFRYLIVPEFHKNGAIHFHGMISGIREEDFTVPPRIWKRDRRNGELILVPNTRKYVDWSYYSKKLGYFSCSKVKNHSSCALYVSKYVTKDLAQLPKGVRAVMSSKGLALPDLVFDEDDIPFVPDEVDFKSPFVWISDIYEHYGILPDWYGECCSELHDLPDLDDETAFRDHALFPRMTGSQLSMYS